LHIHHSSPVHVHAVRGASRVCRGKAVFPRLLSLFFAYVASCVYFFLHLDVRTPRAGTCCITHVPCTSGGLLFQRLSPNLSVGMHGHTHIAHICCTPLTRLCYFPPFGRTCQPTHVPRMLDVPSLHYLHAWCLWQIHLPFTILPSPECTLRAPLCAHVIS
jgi:hypothetical protein